MTKTLTKKKQKKTERKKNKNESTKQDDLQKTKCVACMFSFFPDLEKNEEAAKGNKQPDAGYKCV